MCGIYCKIVPKPYEGSAPLPASQAAVVEATERLRHRGPDAQGVRMLHLDWCCVYIGMARLKIVDQADLAVPYRFEYLGVTLAYNGEIYNWQELRERLADGRPWDTACDAEVIARAWREWGPDMLQLFNGMWGLVLVDELAGEVFVARDRAGEKPVYLLDTGDGSVSVASEIKAFPGQRKRRTCRDLDTLEFDCFGDTPFAGVTSMAPGHYWHLRGGQGLRDGFTCWWDLPRDETISRSYDDAVEECLWLLRDAVKLRYVVDPAVRVGTMFSGGLDSSLIQALHPHDQLYCVTFPGEEDNLTQAVAAAQGAMVRAVSFTRDDLLEALPEIAYHLDTPATWTAVCQWFMCRQMAADGIRVTLSGEGADELFGGYSRYRVLMWLQRMLDDQHLEAYGPLISKVLGDPCEWPVRMLLRGPGTVENKAYIHDRLLDCGDARGLVEALSRTEFYTTMQVLLRMPDRMASAVSMENRAPFLDYRVMEFAARLPVEYKVSLQWSKGLLRDAAIRAGVPDAVVHERTKRGLFIPQQWRPDDAAQWNRKWFSELMNRAWMESFGLT